MTALANIAPTIARLIRLLGSDQDHETLGAARALKRVLASSGADFHTIASTIERATRQQAVPQATSNGQATPTDTADSLASEIIRLQHEHPYQLPKRDIAFVRSQLKWRREPTSKEIDRLFALYSKCLRRGRKL
jgi:hypothetical protein